MTKPERFCCHEHLAKKWFSHIAHGNMFGTQDQNDQWLVPSGIHTVFYHNRWPDNVGYYPTTADDLTSPTNDPCQEGEFKNVNGVCESGVYLKYYDNYQNKTPPELYNPTTSTLEFTIAGITNNNEALKNNACDSLNGTFRLSDLADIQARETFEGDISIYDTDNDYHSFVNETNLCFLGSVALNDDHTAIDSLAYGGYNNINFYLFLSGDDPIKSADGVMPSGQYWRQDLKRTDQIRLGQAGIKVVYRANEIEVKPQLWLAVEFTNNHVPIPAYIEGGLTYPQPPDLVATHWGSQSNVSSDALFLSPNYINSTAPHLSEERRIGSKEYLINTDSCNMVFAKPIGEYNGDYIVQGVSEDASSLIPYHPRCVGEKYSEGNFDGLNIDIDVSFSEADLLSPENSLVTNAVSDPLNPVYSRQYETTAEWPCYFNFNVSITSVDTSSPYINVNDYSSKQACPSRHVKGEVFQYCNLGSNWHFGIVGLGAIYEPFHNLYAWDTENRPYICTQYDPFGFPDDQDLGYCLNGYKFYLDDQGSVPYGSVPTTAQVTFEGVASVVTDGDPTCSDCQDCEDLNTTHRLVFSEDSESPYNVGKLSPDIHIYEYHFDRSYTSPLWRNALLPNGPVLQDGPICCPCGSGLCLESLKLEISPYLRTEYDEAIYGTVYTTKAKLSLIAYDEHVLAEYNHLFGNTKFVEYTPQYGQTKQYGIIDPLDISEFQDVTLNLDSSTVDEAYVRDTLSEDGHANGCSLPDTVTISLNEVTEYNRIPMVLNKYGEIAWEELPQTISINIPNGWGRTSVEDGDFTQSGLGDVYFYRGFFDFVLMNCTCDVDVELIGCALSVPEIFSFFRRYGEPDCEALHNKFLSEKTKVRCQDHVSSCSELVSPDNPFEYVLRRASVFPVYKHTLKNCTDSQFNGLVNYSPYPFIYLDWDEYWRVWFYNLKPLTEPVDTGGIIVYPLAPCGVSDSLCCNIQDLPQGAYGLHLEAGAFVTATSDWNIYRHPVKAPADCQRYDVGRTWSHFEDPCSIFDIKAAPVFSFPDPPTDTVLPCTFDDPVPNDDDDDWEIYGGGVDCGCKSHHMRLDYEYVNYLQGIGFTDTPQIRFRLIIWIYCNGTSSMGQPPPVVQAGVPAEFYGWAFYSDPIDLADVGACSGYDGNFLIEKSKVSNLVLTSSQEGWMGSVYGPYGGTRVGGLTGTGVPYHWDGSTITMTIE